MKKSIAWLLAVMMLCAGTVSAAPKKNVIRMTIPSSYDYVYDRLTEVFGTDADDFYDAVMPVDEEILVDEAPAEEAVVEEAPAMEAAEPQTGGSGDDYSATNTQVEGIDEGDIVKTDGEYIYVLKESGNLVILAADEKNTSLCSSTEVAGQDVVLEETPNYSKRHYHTADYRQVTLRETAKELYISGNTAVVVTESRLRTRSRTDGKAVSDTDYSVVLKLYDVSSPKKPVLITTLGQSGTYETSRMTDGIVYLLTDFPVSLSDRENTEDYIPSLSRNGETEPVPVKSMILPPEFQSMHFTVITGYDLTKQEAVATKSVLMQSDTVYMNSGHLYLADEYSYTDVSEPWKESVYTVTETVSGRCTDICKFAVGEQIVTKAFCTVDGELLNQFAMDEYRGNLRLVTTHDTNTRITYTDEAYGFSNSKRISSEETTGLYIYDENLDLLGSITGLAADERVYSVRFDGDTGYFVTFRQVDPLFAADLSDPRDPEIMSTLKIPGFSEYLHPYGDGLLFGLGQNALLSGRTTGLKLSMFDTTDPYNVTEKHKLLLSADHSAALDNHKAIFISPEKNLIGFPTENGYAVYGYDADNGFYEVKKLNVRWKWRRDSRGLYIGDVFYIVTQTETTALDMTNFEILTTVNY